MTLMTGRGDNDTSVQHSSSEIEPSQAMRAAVGDPHGGEIPMRSICVDRLMCSLSQGIEDK